MNKPYGLPNLYDKSHLKWLKFVFFLKQTIIVAMGIDYFRRKEQLFLLHIWSIKTKTNYKILRLDIKRMQHL